MFKVGFVNTRGKKKATGAGGYRESLFTELSSLKHKHSFSLEEVSPRKKLYKVKCSFSNKMLGKDLIHHEPDPMWYPGCFVGGNQNNIVTIHGVFPLLYPDISPKLQVLRLNLLKKVSKHFDAVITVSKSEKRLISKSMNISENKIYVTYNGNNYLNYSKKMTKEIKKHNDFVLHVSNSNSLESRKNPKLLLESFSKVCSKIDEIDLLIAGKGWKSREFTKYIEKLGISGRVYRLGPISPSNLPSYYASAEVYLQTSLWESFGMPVVEAMTFGTPVVTTEAFAVNEIAGEAPFYVDPTPHHVCNKVTNILRGNENVRQKIETGKVIAKKYTWKKTAQKTLKVYENVINISM